MAELTIRIVKSVLFKWMRFKNTKDWPNLLDEIEDRLNKRHLARLSWKTPNEFANPWNDPKNFKLRKFVDKPLPYKEKEPYIIGTKVYIVGKPKKFKAEWLKKGKTFTIVAIDSKEMPILYKLKDDETNHLLHAKFYSKQLAKVPLNKNGNNEI